MYEKKLFKIDQFKTTISQKLVSKVLVLMEVEFAAGSKNSNQNITLYEVCLLD